MSYIECQNNQNYIETPHQGEGLWGRKKETEAPECSNVASRLSSASVCPERLQHEEKMSISL